MQQMHLALEGAPGQEIDGFGVNLNPVGHWRGGALRPVLDHLIDDLGASLFRVDPYGFSDFLDPQDLRSVRGWNAGVLERTFRSSRFLDSWAALRYLEQRGVRVLTGLTGVVAPSICASDRVTLSDFKGFAALCTSLLQWAREAEGLHIELFGPMNETDIGGPEGPLVSPEAAVEMLDVLCDALAAADLDDVRLVVFDQALLDTRYLEALLDRPDLHKKVAAFSVHTYRDESMTAVSRALDERAPPNWRLWLTEYGDLDQTGEDEWGVALRSTRRLLRALQDGVQAGLVWDAYDNLHAQDYSWSIYGLLRMGDIAAGHGPLAGYTPKPRYSAAKHVYGCVRPGAVLLPLRGEGEGVVATAFRLKHGGLAIVALNETLEDIELSLEVPPEASDPLAAIVSDRFRRMELADASVSAGTLRIRVPAEGIASAETVSSG